jgi:pimeloyl-[acyl-carrier protein] methyl ester esterase
MSLHVERIGSGAPLLLIHGWGMHGGVWDSVAEDLAEDFNVHIVDLPGYGYSEALEATTLDAIVDELSACFAEPLAVCGWSLGGQVALRWAAREPEKVQRLILVASTPCFTERADWEFGMTFEALQQFAAELEQNHSATLRRFLALQLRGSEKERELLALMRDRLFSRGQPDLDALRGGLEILRDADMRGELQYIRQPTLAIAGARDKLTSPEASHFLAQAMPAARVVEIAGAAHAPFLSHPDYFVDQIRRFLHE